VTVLGGVYRGVMAGVAGVAGVARHVPGAPAAWRGARDRLGRLAADDRAAAAGVATLWLHAASVGELTAARPLVLRLRERFPERVLAVSTLTRTGLALARTLPEVHLAFLLPLDAPGPVRRLLDALRLEAFLFTETEIWPTLLGALAARGVPAFMVSGRVSERTAARARWLRPLYRTALAQVSCCMQTPEDAGRIVELGADPRRVVVAGSLKFDAAAAEPPADVQRLATRLGPRRLLVAGSTHAGEEESVLDAYRRVAAGRPDLVLLLAPRHPERLEGVAQLVAEGGLALRRYATLDATPLPEGPVVVLLDVLGPLAHCYALATLAFVGGSLVPIGGHNLLEPARAGRPILVGPHTGNAAEVAERLVAGGGALRVSSADSLAWAIAGLLDEPERAADMGRKARALVERGQGAVERHLKVIAARLSSAQFAHGAGGR
jgi:3-deoxy-D-manno-octulosonic-acid transferase